MVLTAYQAHWPEHFEKIKKALLLKECVHIIGIEHIGSTAVPGLPAKPIIDIDIIYNTSSDFVHIRSHLRRLGYQHSGNQGIAHREVFKRGKNQNHAVLDGIKHHLYACPALSEELNRHITFRDYLRNHPEKRIQYADLKNEIANKSGQDRKKYAALKESEARSFILECLQDAH